jgi:hypothetical protein
VVLSRRALRSAETVETAAQTVLDARAQYPTSTLADLYDPLTMPDPLLMASQDLGRAVDPCYHPGIPDPNWPAGRSFRVATLCHMTGFDVLIDYDRLCNGSSMCGHNT